MDPKSELTESFNYENPHTNLPICKDKTQFLIHVYFFPFYSAKSNCPFYTYDVSKVRFFTRNIPTDINYKMYSNFYIQTLFFVNLILHLFIRFLLFFLNIKQTILKSILYNKVERYLFLFINL